MLNVRRSLEVADKLLEMGHIPYCPCLSHFWHYISPKPWDVWLKIDQDWLSICDAVLRLPGESRGADLEVELAKKLCMLIYYSLESIPKGNETDN